MNIYIQMKIKGFNEEKITDTVLEIFSLQVKKCPIKMQDALYFISIKKGNNSIFLFLNKKIKSELYPFFNMAIKLMWAVLEKLKIAF